MAKNRIKLFKKINDKKSSTCKTWFFSIMGFATFHQNQFGKPNSEERIVQYLCYLPKNHKKNTGSMIAKRFRYFETRRTTSHWPTPINVNGLQPNTRGDKSLNIDYSKLKPPKLDDIMEEIQKLL